MAGVWHRQGKKFRIGTSVSVSGNVACHLCSANESNTRFWRYFSRHWEVIPLLLCYRYPLYRKKMRVCLKDDGTTRRRDRRRDTIHTCEWATAQSTA